MQALNDRERHLLSMLCTEAWAQSVGDPVLDVVRDVLTELIHKLSGVDTRVWIEKPDHETSSITGGSAS